MALPSWWVTPSTNWDPTNPAHWQELAAIDQPGSGGSYARDDGAETLVGHIPASLAYSARLNILGYAYADTAYPWLLYRVNPLQHPDEGHLRATSVDMVGYNPMGQASSGSSYISTIPSQLSGVSPTFPNRINYTRRACSIKFRPSTFPYYSDADMVTYTVSPYTSLPEYYRNTTVFDSQDPVLQVLAAGSQSYLQWADIPAASGVTGTPPVPAAPTQYDSTGLDAGEIPVLFSQATFVMVWHQVPIDYICNPFIPTKIMNCMGKLNSNVNWLGEFPAMTLKLDAPRIKIAVQSHVRVNNFYRLPFVVDVFFPFQYFNPTPGAVTSGGGVPSQSGWNLYPWNQSDQFYAVQRKAAPGVGVFQTADFDQMFTHVLS